MKHMRHIIVCTARDVNGTHSPSRRPTQEGSAVKWSRTRDKSPLSAASKMSGLPWMRAAAACKTDEIGARECGGGKQHLGVKSGCLGGDRACSGAHSGIGDLRYCCPRRVARQLLELIEQVSSADSALWIHGPAALRLKR